jgi:hypothetical protein
VRHPLTSRGSDQTRVSDEQGGVVMEVLVDQVAGLDVPRAGGAGDWLVDLTPAA